MTGYEMLLDVAQDKGLTVTEVPLVFYDGLIKNRKIGIRKNIETSAEKADVLAEEISHADLTVGNILDQTICANRKQEYKARMKSYDMRIGLDGIVKVVEMGCENAHEAAECLGVGEKFFNEALEHYHEKYGTCVQYRDYTIIFEPTLDIIKT